MTEFILSTEELALLLSIIGRPEAGQTLMAAQLGKTTEAEARARLLAASHSLMARGLLALGPEGPILESPLAHTIECLSQPNFSIRYSRSTQEAELALIYHFRQNAILEHRLEQGVAHHLAEVPGASAVIQGGLLFFGLPQAQPFTAALIRIPYQTLIDLKDEEDPAVVEESLRKAGVAEEARPLLAEDLAHPRYRGSALQVRYDPQGKPYSEKGFLLLHGPQRLWLISLEIREPTAAVLKPATVQAFHQAVTALL